MSLIGIVFNIQLLKYAWENGVAAYGVLMYVSMIFFAIFLGYSSGFAPVFEFHFGARDYKEFRGLLKRSLVIIVIFSVSMFVFAELLAYPIASIFVGYDKVLMKLTLDGFFIYLFSYLFMGVAIFGSSFFTALNNGLVSAIISFLRTIVFQLGAVLLLPLIWKVSGIWSSIVVAEFMASIVCVTFIVRYKKI